MKYLSPRPPQEYAINGVGIGPIFASSVPGETPAARNITLETRGAAWNLLWLAWPEIDAWLEGGVVHDKQITKAALQTVMSRRVPWLQGLLVKGDAKTALLRLRALPGWSSLPISEVMGPGWIDTAFQRANIAHGYVTPAGSKVTFIDFAQRKQR